MTLNPGLHSSACGISAYKRSYTKEVNRLKGSNGLNQSTMDIISFRQSQNHSQGFNGKEARSTLLGEAKDSTDRCQEIFTGKTHQLHKHNLAVG